MFAAAPFASAPFASAGTGPRYVSADGAAVGAALAAADAAYLKNTHADVQASAQVRGKGQVLRDAAGAIAGHSWTDFPATAWWHAVGAAFGYAQVQVHTAHWFTTQGEIAGLSDALAVGAYLAVTHADVQACAQVHGRGQVLRDAAGATAGHSWTDLPATAWWHAVGAAFGYAQVQVHTALWFTTQGEIAGVTDALAVGAYSVVTQAHASAHASVYAAAQAAFPSGYRHCRLSEKISYQPLRIRIEMSIP